MRKIVARTLLATGVFFAVCWLMAPSGGYVPRLTTGLDVCDYRFFIKKCLVEAEPYCPVTIVPHDACYPPIAYCLVKFFPLTAQGEAIYVSFLFAGLIAGFALFLLQRHRRHALLCIGAVVLTIPFASGPLRGNPSAWAAGALFVYLAWFDSSTMWKRMVAAVALAFATALKIAPAIYGLLYLRGRLFRPEKWPKEEIFISAMSFVFLFIIPFHFFGGADSVEVWAKNAIGNSAHYSPVADFGLVPVVRLFDRWLPHAALGLAVYLTTLLAVLLGFASCFARRLYHALALLGVAMALLCHHDYGLVYLLPAFACWLGETGPNVVPGWLGNTLICVEALLWFLILEPALCALSLSALWFCYDLCNGAVLMLGMLALSYVVASFAINRQRGCVAEWAFGGCAI